MKKILPTIYIIFLCACYEGTDFNKATSTTIHEPKPIIMVTTEDGELGNGGTYTLTPGSPGEEVQVLFTIENRGGQMLELSRYPEICGGSGEVFELNIEKTQMTVNPGEYTVFSLLYSPGNNSIYEQSFVCIRIISNAPNTEQYDIYAVYDR